VTRLQKGHLVRLASGPSGNGRVEWIGPWGVGSGRAALVRWDATKGLTIIDETNLEIRIEPLAAESRIVRERRTNKAKDSR
jgi:hypothetical protein